MLTCWILKIILLASKCRYDWPKLFYNQQILQRNKIYKIHNKRCVIQIKYRISPKSICWWYCRNPKEIVMLVNDFSFTAYVVISRTFKQRDDIWSMIYLHQQKLTQLYFNRWRMSEYIQESPNENWDYSIVWYCSTTAILHIILLLHYVSRLKLL